MPEPNDRIFQPPQREPMTTDRKIAITGVAVAAVGALAAVAVVPEFRCWAFNDGCSASSTPSSAAIVPAILGFTGFFVYFLLSRTKGNDNITLQIVEKIRVNTPDLFATNLPDMTPAMLGKTIAVNERLRREVGDHDFQLLQQVIRNQFLTSLVVYALCTFCFVVGVVLYFLLQPPKTFSQQLIFRGDNGSPAIVTGSVQVVYEDEARSAALKDATNITISGVSSSEMDKPFNFLIVSDEWSAPSEQQDAPDFIFSKRPITVLLHRKPDTPFAGSLFVKRDPLVGAKVALHGLPCESVTRENGYFEFQHCPQSKRLEAAELDLTLPSSGEACPNSFPLLPPPKLTGILINSDCSLYETRIESCAGCRPDFDKILPDKDKKLPSKKDPDRPNGENHPVADACRRAIQGQLWTRLNPAQWQQRTCGVTCHVNISRETVVVYPGQIQFPTPGSCEPTELNIDPAQLFDGR